MTVVYSADVIKDRAECPVQLEKIHFENVGRTKYDALVKETRQLFNATTLRELVHNAYLAQQHMVKVGLFDDVMVVVDSPTTIDQPNSTESVDLVFVVHEPSRSVGSVSVAVERSEAYGKISGLMKSVFGRAEVLRGSVDVGHRNTTLFSTQYSKPFLGWADSGLQFGVTRCSRENPAACYSRLANSFSVQLHHKTFRQVLSEVTWEGSWRHLSALSKTTPFSVREQSGHSLKSSLSHKVSWDSLDCPILPKKGLHIHAYQELAGLKGDVSFLKHHLNLKGATPLLFGWFMSADLNASLIQPRNGQKVQILDRLFLGGCDGDAMLRGFSYDSVGPKDSQAYTGGVARWIASVDLFRPLYPVKVVYAHMFAQAGSLLNEQQTTFTVANGTVGLVDALHGLTDSPRYCIGAGLLLKLTERFRLEANYVLPFSNCPTDQLAPGLQISFVAASD